MASIGKVRAVFTASTSGLVSATEQASAAFKRLGGDSATLQTALARLSAIDAAGFSNVGPAATAAAAQLETLRTQTEGLYASLRSGAITAQEFAAGMAQVTQAAEQSASALARGAELSKKYQTAEQALGASVAELDNLLQRGAISHEVYAQAMADAYAAYARTAASAAGSVQAETQRQAAMDRGAQVSREYAAAEVTLGERVNELNNLLREGAITEDVHARAMAAAREEYARNTGAAAAAAQAERERQAVIARGASVTQSLQTAQETYASTISELSTLLEEGVISVQTYERGVASAQETFNNATGVTSAQARAMDDLTQAMNRGQSITQQVATAEERYASTVQELNTLLSRGAISQQTYERAVRQASDELKKSQAGANAFSAGARQVQNSVGAVVSRLNTLIAIQGAQLFAGVVRGVSSVVSSFVDLGRSQAETIDSQGKLAQRLGFTYAELSGIALAGDLAGVSIDQIGNAATKADVAFVKAANGSKVAVQAFESIGLSLDDINGLTAADRFGVIVDAIAALPTEAERSAAAVRLFGRSGAELLPLFNEGAGGIRAATAEAQKLGLSLSGAQFRSVETMRDSFDKARAAIQGVIGQVVAYLAPAVSSVSTAFTELIGNVGGATIGQTIGEGLLQGARFLAGVGDSLIGNLSAVWDYVSQVGGQWNAVFDAGNRVAAFFSGVGDTLKAAFGLIILGITGPVEGLVEGAKAIGEALGLDTSGLDSTLAAMKGFNESIADSITTSAESAAKNFKTAVFGSDSESRQAGEAIAGPLTTTIDAAIARARDAASQVDESVPQTVEVKQAVDISASKVAEALNGVDSRSREGVAEMFRLLRGDTGNVQERIARAAERTADAIENLDDDYEVVDLAPAAGV